MKNRQAEIIKHMDPRELLYHLYLSQIAFFAIGLVLAYFLFNSFQSFKEIFAWQPINIFVIGTLVALVVVAADLLLMKMIPKSLLDDGGINEKMFQTRSLPHIILLAFVISFAEEFLFRGVIQTHFGIWIASILFAVLHVRYLHKWVLFISVVVISFVLGFIYEVTGSLWVTIWTHFLIDLMLAYKIRADYLKNINKEKAGVVRNG
ncbi:CPBP family intramembrane glutamic endopeptidase [Sutcliffiella horikoshii]|uniref:CPBP family intramembrane glutamic endopeptidase n=1 Tax=Sutcliffiella horikoshii TaxID=79883 RepID=UPI001CFF064E|nr:CPBP family intramembrane glutamic endopeptidase [Sutcliffiella horikoshii]